MRDPQQELDDLAAAGLRRELRILAGPDRAEDLASSATVEIAIGSERLINFSSNDYLGLANSEDLKRIYQEAIGKYGVGSGASRLICGTMAAHVELEERIAELKRTPAGLTFSSGFATATGSIPAIVGKDDIIILDKLCHASLIDGARLSGAVMRVFPHNDLNKLASLLKWAAGKKSPKSRVLVITESVFSMDGDRAPLREICDLVGEAGALLMVDEAHALGVIGPGGRGLAAELGLEGRIDFQMGTFSKAIGLSGGYLCASRAWIDLMINRARSFIYSTAPAPALAETISASLDLITSSKGDLLREKLWERINVAVASSRRFNRVQSPIQQGTIGMETRATSAILPVVIGDNEEALNAAQFLRVRGFLVPAIRFPTVPRGTARLRVTISAAHRREDIERLNESLEQLVNSRNTSSENK